MNSVGECKKVLVVDDSILTGSEINRVRETIRLASLQAKVIYYVVFYAPERANDIDIGSELCPLPRVFEWNLMHGHTLPKCCVMMQYATMQEKKNSSNHHWQIKRDPANSYIAP